jgi:hypothetical protein
LTRIESAPNESTEIVEVMPGRRLRNDVKFRLSDGTS